MAVYPVVGQFPAFRPRTHSSQGARADVETGCQHDHFALVLPALVAMPRSVIRTIGVVLASTNFTCGRLNVS